MFEQELEFDDIKSPFDVNFDDPENIIGVQNDDPLTTVERRAQEFKSNFGQTSPLLNVVREEIGADYILSGDPDNPTQISLYDLNDRQLADLLRHRYQESVAKDLAGDDDYDLDDAEIELLNALRSGDNARALAMLGANPYENSEYSDDDVIEWKLRSIYPDMTDDEIAEEVDIWKQSPNSDRKLRSARQELYEQIQSYQQTQQQQFQQERESLMNREAEQIVSMIQDIDSLYQFEVDDETKQNVYDLLFTKTDSGKSKIVESMDSPETLLEIATSVALMPKIAGYVNQLLDEIDNLKKNRGIVVDNKNVYNSKQPSRFGRAEDGVEDVSNYFRLG